MYMENMPVHFQYRRINSVLLIIISTITVYLYMHNKWKKFDVTLPDILCNASFGRNLLEDIEKIKSYRLSEGDRHLQRMGLARLSVQRPLKTLRGPGAPSIEVPAVVTASSENHFQESMEMLRRLNSVVRQSYKEIDVYYYDLGLRPEQREQVKKLCNCTVLDFPFEKFPPHVSKLKGYCWKPLIIKMMLQSYQFVMWMDASIQFSTSDLDPLFEQAKQQGILMLQNKWPLVAHTHQDTFNFLEETPCLFRNFSELHAGLILIHTGHSLVRDYVIEPWVACALIEDCMKTRHNEWDLVTCTIHNQYHACHRFDQAVVSLLICRLFHDTYLDHTIDEKYFRICNNLKC